MTLWTYRETDGTDVVVSRFEDIPQAYRSKAKTIDQVTQPQAALTFAVPQTLHLPSFLAGAGAAMLACTLLFVVFRRRTRMVGMVLGSLAIAAAGAGYLTYLRSQAGLGSTVATPASIVNDAKAATDALKLRMQAQEKQLQELEK